MRNQQGLATIFGLLGIGLFLAALVGLTVTGVIKPIQPSNTQIAKASPTSKPVSNKYLTSTELEKALDIGCPSGDENDCLDDYEADDWVDDGLP